MSCLDLFDQPGGSDDDVSLPWLPVSIDSYHRSSLTIVALNPVFIPPPPLILLRIVKVLRNCRNTALMDDEMGIIYNSELVTISLMI